MRSCIQILHPNKYFCWTSPHPQCTKRSSGHFDKLNFCHRQKYISFSRSLNKNTYNKPFSIVYLILDLEQCATRPNGRRTYWAWLWCCHLYWIVQARQSILCAITFEQFLATRYLPNTLYKRISRANWIFIFCIIAEYHKYHQPLDPLREALGDKKDLVVSWQKNKEWNHNFKFLLPIARRYQLDVGHIGTYCT